MAGDDGCEVGKLGEVEEPGVRHDRVASLGLLRASSTPPLDLLRTTALDDPLGRTEPLNEDVLNEVAEGDLYEID
jgi:hypothetical protein